MAVSSKIRQQNGVVEQNRRETSPAEQGGSVDFLTFHFDELPAAKVKTVTDRCGGLNLKRLESQVYNYLRIYSDSFEILDSDISPLTDFEKIAYLHDLLLKNLGDFDGVELVKAEDVQGEKQDEFVVYKNHDDFVSCHIFFMPIGILDFVDDDLYNILVDFFAFLERKGPFLLPDESTEMMFTLGLQSFDYDCMEEGYDEEMAESWDPEFRDMVDNYLYRNVRGYFDDIKARRQDEIDEPGILQKRILKSIEEYRQYCPETIKVSESETKEISQLLDLIVQGVKLHLEDNLFNYDLVFIRRMLGDDSFMDDGFVDSESIMELERQFIFVYEMEDEVAQECVNVFNANDCNYSTTALLSAHPLSKIKDKVKISDFPKRWEQWNKDITNFL